jgi:GNAT superfamily N-acetyltransferase
MSDISVRVLQEDDWHAYRDVRLAALRESPKAFLATYAEEAKQPELYWRNCMVQAHRLLALRDEGPVGVASVEMIEGAPQSADLHDLWVTPEARNTGVASRLVQSPQIERFRTVAPSCTTGPAPKTGAQSGSPSMPDSV